MQRIQNPRSERRLAAIMFTDLVGSTAIMARSEESALAMKQYHRSLARSLVERYHGRWIESPGDETLSTFPNALDAVNCALAIQQERSGNEDLRIHVGIHSGDIIDRDGEIHGDGVNIAARVCSLSEGGGICITGEVRQSVRNHANVRCTELEERELKNVGRAVAVFSVEGEPLAPSALRPRSIAVPALMAAVVLALVVGTWWLARPDVDASGTHSIAVLPLENLSGDPEQEYFAAGLTEELIAVLARIGALRVTSRTSVMQYKDIDRSLPEIARELGVDSIVEGSVLRVGDSVRITAQLIDARTDRHLWSASYERDLSDLLAMQSEIARAIAREIEVEFDPHDDAGVASQRLDPMAHEAYLKGLYFLGQAGSESRKKAKQLFEQVIEIEPDYAPAYAQLATAYS